MNQDKVKKLSEIVGWESSQSGRVNVSEVFDRLVDVLSIEYHDGETYDYMYIEAIEVATGETLQLFTASAVLIADLQRLGNLEAYPVRLTFFEDGKRYRVK